MLDVEINECMLSGVAFLASKTQEDDPPKPKLRR
jgi:hypothetical protein